MASLRVGICITNSKKLKMKLPSCLLNLCHINGIELVDIDMQGHLEEQGPFDIILHKVLEWSNEDKERGALYVEKFQKYLSNQKDTILIDPIDTCVKLTNRLTMLEAGRNCQFCLNGRRVFVPEFVLIGDERTTCNDAFISSKRMKLPIIVKHYMGASFGKQAHDMCIILDERELPEVKPPCILQQFHNHNGIMVKIYVIGEKFYLCKRPSIKNLNAGPFPTLFFNSCEVSKRERKSPLHDSDLVGNFPVGEDKMLLEEEIVIELLKRLHLEFDFNLLGIDIIVDNCTGDYGIVDINYFPGYDGVKSYVPQDFVDLFIKVGRG